MRTDPGTGHWQVIFETRDESEWHAHLRRLRAGAERIDWAMTRIDTLCGRLVHPTTYRLSLFVPGPARDPSGDHPGGGTPPTDPHATKSQRGAPGGHVI